MYQEQPFQNGKAEFPILKDIKKQPVFTCLQKLLTDTRFALETVCLQSII